jgi:hypothetical protein
MKRPGDELKAGDKCPIDGGEMVPDPLHDPERLADLNDRNSDKPEVSARYRRQVMEKAQREGVIHRCVRCGYQARMPLADEGASSGQGASASTGQGASSSTGQGAGSGTGQGDDARRGEGDDRVSGARRK